MSFGIPFTIFRSGNTFGCCRPGFWNSSNDNTRPTADCVLPFGVGWDGLAFDVGVVEVVGEAVVAGALVVGAGAVSFTSVWAVDDGAELSAVGALDPSIVVGLLDTELGVDTVAGEDWVVWTDVLEVRLVGLAGFTGDTGLVGLVVAFLQVSDVVAQAPNTGWPYGFGQVDVRV